MFIISPKTKDSCLKDNNSTSDKPLKEPVLS